MIRLCERSYRETMGLPQLLPREVKFFLNRTRPLCMHLKVVLIRHQDFPDKVFYMINFFLSFLYFAERLPHPHFSRRSLK